VLYVEVKDGCHTPNTRAGLAWPNCHADPFRLWRWETGTGVECRRD
jgi:hypothetical protein